MASDMSDYVGDDYAGVQATRDAAWANASGSSARGTTGSLSSVQGFYPGDKSQQIEAFLSSHPGATYDSSTGQFTLSGDAPIDLHRGKSDPWGDLVLGSILGLAGGEAFGAFMGGIGSEAGVAATDAAESGGTLALNDAGTGVSQYSAGVDANALGDSATSVPGATSDYGTSSNVYGNTYAANDTGTMTDTSPYAGSYGSDVSGSTVSDPLSASGISSNDPIGDGSAFSGSVAESSAGGPFEGGSAGVSANEAVSPFKNFNNFMKENRGLMSAGSLAASVLRQPRAHTADLSALASQLSSTAALTSSASTGNLPAGAEASVSNALNSAQQSIRAKYANLGLSGSTMEAQELSAANSNAQAMRFQMSQQLAQTGLQAAGLEERIYAAIMQAVMSQDQGLQNALARFAAASAVGAWN